MSYVVWYFIPGKLFQKAFIPEGAIEREKKVSFHLLFPLLTELLTESVVLVNRLFYQKFFNLFCVSPFMLSQAIYQHMQGISFRKQEISLSILLLLQFHVMFDCKSHTPILLMWLKM